MIWGCLGVEPIRLTTVMKCTTEIISETDATVKLGIDGPAICYFVAWQRDGTTAQPVQSNSYPGY